MKKNKDKLTEDQPNNPLHGVRLDEMVEYLVAEHGWEKLGKLTGIRAFTNRPTLKSSVKMLRKTSWARAKLEDLYMASFRRQ